LINYFKSYSSLGDDRIFCVTLSFHFIITEFFIAFEANNALLEVFKVSTIIVL